MGALEIRRASENLKPIGSFRMPELDTGASKAFTAQANAAKAAADAARVVGSATIHGIMDRGRIVSRTLGHLGEIAMEVFNRENERVADEKFVEKSGWWDLEMNGDGTAEHPGRFNQPVDDVKEWLKGIKDANREADERIMKDMSAAQREIYRRKIARTELSWQGRIGQHAAKVTLGNQVAKAKEASDVCLYKAAESFTGGNPIERDAAIMEAFEAYGHFLDAQAIPKEQQELAMRPYAVQLVSSGLDARIRNLHARTADCDDAGAVSADWTDQIKAFEAAGFVPDNAQLKAYIGKDGLTEAETTMLRDKLEEAHVKAVRQAEALYKRNASEVGSKYDQAEAECAKNLSMDDYIGNLEAWAKDPALAKYDPARAQRYLQYADAIREADRINREANGVLKESGAAAQLVDPNVFRDLPSEKRLKEDLLDGLTRLTVARVDGTTASEVSRMQFDLMQKYQIATRVGLVDAAFKEKFENAVSKELKGQTRRALAKWYNAWGIHPQTDSSGRPVKGETETAGDLFVPTTAGAADGANGTLTRQRFFELTSELTGIVESSPDEYNREAAIDELIGRVRTEGLESAYDQEASAAKEVGGLLTEIQLDLSAERVYRSMTESVPDGEPPKDGEDQSKAIPPTDEELAARREDYDRKRKDAAKSRYERSAAKRRVEERKREEQRKRTEGWLKYREKHPFMSL